MAITCLIVNITNVLSLATSTTKQIFKRMEDFHKRVCIHLLDLLFINTFAQTFDTKSISVKQPMKWMKISSLDVVIKIEKWLAEKSQRRKENPGPCKYLVFAIIESSER